MLLKKSDYVNFRHITGPYLEKKICYYVVPNFCTLRPTTPYGIDKYRATVYKSIHQEE